MLGLWMVLTWWLWWRKKTFLDVLVLDILNKKTGVNQRTQIKSLLNTIKTNNTAECADTGRLNLYCFARATTSISSSYINTTLLQGASLPFLSFVIESLCGIGCYEHENGPPYPFLPPHVPVRFPHRSASIHTRTSPIRKQHIFPIEWPVPASLTIAKSMPKWKH